MVLGFEPTTFGSWVSSHNHSTRVPTLRLFLHLETEVSNSAHARPEMKVFKKCFILVLNRHRVLKEGPATCVWTFCQFKAQPFIRKLKLKAPRSSILFKKTDSVTAPTRSPARLFFFFQIFFFHYYLLISLIRGSAFERKNVSVRLVCTFVF